MHNENENGTLSLDALLRQASGVTTATDDADEDAEPTEESDTTETPETPEATDTSDNTEAPADDTNKTPAKTPTKAKEETKKPNPIKEIRDRFNAEQKLRERISGIVQRFSDGDYSFKLKDFKTEDGKVDYDALEEAMNNSDVDSRAKTNNVTPEQQRLKEQILEEQKELAKERLKINMDRALASMQVELGLTRKDINQFFSDALSQKRNPYQWLNAGGDIQDLYNIIYMDKVIESRVTKAVEEERAKWTSPTQTKAPATNPAPKTAPQPTAQNNGITLDDLLKEAFGKKK